MRLLDALNKNLVQIDLQFESKKRALEKISAHVAEFYPGFNQAELFSALMARERLGSTALGHGIAVPHCRSQSIDQCIAGIFRLNNGIDYDGSNSETVDIIVLILVPENEAKTHLTLLADIAEHFSKSDFCSRIRQAPTENDIFDFITNYDGR